MSRSTFAFLGALALAAAPASAQTPPSAAVIQSSRPPITSTPQPALDTSPRTAPVVTAGDEPAAQSDGGPTFLLQSVTVEGDAILTREQVDAVTRPYIGRRVTFGDLTALTRALERAGRERGSLLATATLPPQKVTGGAVRIAVRQGQLGKINVEGERHYSERFIRRFFHPFDSRGRVSLPSVTRSLLVLNEFMDLQVQSVFTRGVSPGTADVTLAVRDRRPFHVDLEYNNFGNRLIGRNRAAIGLIGGNVFTDGDDMLVRLTEPFPSIGDPFYQFGYNAPVGDWGSRLGFAFLRARTVIDPTAGVGIFPGTNGTAEIYALTYQKALERTLDRSSSLATGFVAKSIKNNVLENFSIGNDQIRALSSTYSLASNKRRGRLIVNGGVMVGLGTAFGGNSNSDPRQGRVGAGNQFVKANVDALRLITVSPKENLILRLSGQLASDPQVTAEQFAIGGPDSVRGYIQAEQLGDEGYFASMEFRRTLVQKPASNLQALAFVDHGHVYNELPTPFDGPRTLTGAGVGARAVVDRNTSLRLDLGFPLDPNRTSLNYSSMLYAQANHRF